MISNDICTRSQKCLKLSTTKIAVFSSLQFCLLFFVWVGKKFEMDFLSREIHLSQKLCSTQWVKIAKFYLLAMLKSGILFSKSNILCKYPLQSWCPFLMNTKWQVEKNTNSMHTHTEKKYSQRTHIKTATNKETSSTAAFVLCRFLLPLWLNARSFLYE